MIKINKNLADVPVSLQPALNDIFSGSIPKASKTTHEKRIATITLQKYLDNNNNNSRYKLKDIRDSLKRIYNDKCAYCENIVEQLHVDHYRPKSIYYWLVYSWDNLIISCPYCNIYKGEEFEISGTRANYNDDSNIIHINTLSSTYDLSEQPSLVNPENDDPYNKIEFHLNGKITSSDYRFDYTIRTCRIDRKYLNDQRRTITDKLKNNLRDALLDNMTVNDQVVAIRTCVKNFVSESKDVSSSFTAFRRFAIEKRWVDTLLKTLREGDV